MVGAESPGTHDKISFGDFQGGNGSWDVSASFDIPELLYQVRTKERVCSGVFYSASIPQPVHHVLNRGLMPSNKMLFHSAGLRAVSQRKLLNFIWLQ